MEQVSELMRVQGVEDGAESDRVGIVALVDRQLTMAAGPADHG
jgi:hypothetical protein